MLSSESPQHFGLEIRQSRELNDEAKWRAVLSRDERFDGAFVFAVRSTGIYCRPSCPARRPARQQVEFFRGSIEAEQSGYRACLRCQPGQTGFSSKTRLVDLACKYIEANLQHKLTLATISGHVGLSPFYFHRTFKAVLGITPRQYVESRRTTRMKRFLRMGETVNNSLCDAGFSSRSRVYENLPDGFGISPGEYRRGGEGLQISYRIIGSPLGRLLIAGTKRGVCAVCIGDTDTFVENCLAEDFPSAALVKNDEAMKMWAEQLTKYLAGEQMVLDLPLDVKATAFQLRVWKAIQSIPFGATATYSQLASDLGQPQAARAVARACATNPVALVIPCHRVIGRDGSLRGYRWGIKRKQKLLDLETNVEKKRDFKGSSS